MEKTYTSTQVVKLHDQVLTYVHSTGDWIVTGYVASVLKAYPADRRRHVRVLKEEAFRGPYDAMMALMARVYPQQSSRAHHRLALKALELSLPSTPKAK